MGFPPVPVRRSRRRLPPLPAAVGWVAPFGRFGFLGVCRGCSLSLFRLRAGRSRGSPLGSLLGRALGRFRLGSVVPPLASVALRLRGRCPVFLVRRCVALRAVLGSAASRPPRLLRRAFGGRWLRGFRAGLPVRAAVPVGVTRSGGRSRGLAVRSLSLFPSAAPAVVGFSGSRRLAPAFAPLVGVDQAVVSPAAISITAGRAGCSYRDRTDHTG